MKDNYGREIDYIRVSVTDRCNLRCKYCMPEETKWIPSEEILTFEEVAQVCKSAAHLGIRKVKLTGGEPLVRRDCAFLAGMIKAIPGIEQVTLTTNGVLLDQYAEALYQNGIDGINVSIDTLDREKYQRITGSDVLPRVWKGLETAMNYPIPIKINTVLRKETSIEEYLELAALTGDRKLDVRFIEMMPIGHGKDEKSISGEELKQELEREYGKLLKDETVHGNGPAVYYRLPGCAGSVGFISAMHTKFCNRCNRIRLTSTGTVKGCLCYNSEVSLKEALREGNYKKVTGLLEKAIREKPEEHIFEQLEKITEKKEMAKIGG